MPAFDVWEAFFNPNEIFDALDLPHDLERAVEFGCGYGTFTIPLCQRLAGIVESLEMDHAMVRFTHDRAAALNIHHLILHEADFDSVDTLIQPESVDLVLLFNILHGESPDELIKLSWQLLKSGGRIAVIHWRYDEQTPRGPPMAIRPKPEALTTLANNGGFSAGDIVALPPYHYGFTAIKDPS